MPLSESEGVERAREKARLRKRRYDEKARGTPTDDGVPPRRGVVLHLSEAARTVLKENRQRRRVAGFAPVLDSELVESLLLDYAAQPVSDLRAARLVVGETKSSERLDTLIATIRKYETQLKAATEELEEHRESRLLEWDEMERLLLEAHRRFGRYSSAAIADRARVAEASAEARALHAKDVHDAVEQHISDLVFQMRLSCWG